MVCVNELRHAARTIFFGVNLTILLAFGTCAAICIAEGCVGGGSPFAFLGGLVAIIPLAICAVSEWRAFFHRRRSLEKHLGFGCYIAAGILIFGVVANVLENVASDSPRETELPFSIILAIMLCIAVYLAACGAFRTRIAAHVGEEP